MRKTQKAAFVSVALAATLVMSGCSGGSGSGGSSNELDVWIPSDATGAAEAYVDSFNKANTQYTVKLRQIPFAQYDNALGQAFSAGEGPDLAQINGTTFPSFAAKGFLQPIVPLVGSDADLATANFYPGLYTAGQYEGKQLALPLDTGTRVLQYNKKLLEKAGVAPFGETASFDEIQSAAEKVRALGNGVQGFCYVGADKWYTVNSNAGPFVVQSGGSFISEDGKTAELNTPAAAEGFNFFKALAATSDQSNLVSTASAPCVEGFGAGTVGMQFDGFWDIPSAAQITGDFELGQTLPTNKTTYSSTGGWVMGVPTYVKSDKSAVLKAFMEAMYQPSNIVQFTGLMPATISGRDAATKLKDPQYDIYWKILNENASNPIPLNAGLVEQANLLTTAMQEVIQGTKSTDDALKEANDAIQATLN